MADKNELQAKERKEFEDMSSSSRDKFSNLIVRGGECDKAVIEDFFKVINPDEFKDGVQNRFWKQKVNSQTTQNLLFDKEYQLVNKAFIFQEVLERVVMEDIEKAYEVNPQVDYYSFYEKAMQQGNVQIVDEMMKEKEQGKVPLDNLELFEKLKQQMQKAQDDAGWQYANGDKIPVEIGPAGYFEKIEELEFSYERRKYQSADQYINSIFPKIRKEVGAEIKGYMSASTRAKLNDSRGEKSGAVIADKIVEETKGQGSKYPKVGRSLAEHIAYKLRGNNSNK